MANLRCSAAKESEDTLNVFTSPTGYEPNLLAQRLISSLLLHDPIHGPGRG